jgi:hypothetical protein
LTTPLFALAPTFTANCGTDTTDGLGVIDVAVGAAAPPRLYRFELARLDLDRFGRLDLDRFERLDLDRFERLDLDLDPPLTFLSNRANAFC